MDNKGVNLRRTEGEYTPAEIDAKYKAWISKRDAGERAIEAQGVTEPPENCNLALMGSFAEDDPEAHESLRDHP